MSVTHLVLGSVAVKSRSRWLRTYAGRIPLRLRRHCRRWGMPYSPFRAMSLAIDAIAAGGLALVGQDLVHPGHAHYAIACRVVFTDASE